MKKVNYAVIFFLVLICLAFIIFRIKEAKPSMNISLLHADGLNIADEKGKPVLLKGLCLTNNVWGSWKAGVSEKLRDKGDDPLIRPLVQDSGVLDEDDFNRIKGLGLNCVRYCFNYQLFSVDNPNRPGNIKKLKKDIERFAGMGIYTIPVLMMAPGLDTQNDTIEYLKPGPDRIRSVFEDETYFMQMMQMWKYVASELKDTPGLAGYELINEPRVPCDAEGGVGIFKERLTALCEEIRKADAKHIIFVPEYNSIEANPGEEYWNNSENKLTVDQGEQGVIWKTGLVKTDLPNLVYVIHYYDTYNFTAYGIGSMNKEAIDAYIAGKADWAKETGKAPLICTEYGIARVNQDTVRIPWMEEVHSLFEKYDISATYFAYKGPVGAYINTKECFWPVYAEYESFEDEITLRGDGSYVFNSDEIEQSAAKNRFIPDLEKYFIPNGKFRRVSIMDNGPMLEALQGFWKYKQNKS